MASQVYLRPAVRSDLPTLTRITNDANHISSLHNRLCPYQRENPISYFQWRHVMTRQRFIEPSIRTIVACSSATDEILGHATWAAEGKSNLLDKWTEEASPWSNLLEKGLLKVEETYIKYVSDRCVDWHFLKTFLAVAGEHNANKPPSLHLYLLSVDPSSQSKGIGRHLVNWGFALAEEEGLPIVLESQVEAQGFYEKLGFSRLQDIVVRTGPDDEYTIPIFASEGQAGTGKWLEEAGQGRWQWKT